MILTCPECATRYQIDPAQFPPEGRKVRCAKCSHVWFQAAPAPEPEPEVVHVQEHEEEPVAAEEPSLPEVAAQRTAYAPSASSYYEEEERHHVAEAPQARRSLRGVGLALGWLVLALIVAATGWITVRFRQDVASLWPQTASLYKVLGLYVNTHGIEFADKNARWETENGQNVLLISGDLVNITSHELTVPPIRVSLSDADRREVYHWSFSSAVPTLGPGKSLSFQTRLPSPPITASHIELRFVEPGN